MRQPAVQATGGKENGYEYKVAAGDTLSIIAKAYREQGIKVTAEQILKANPGLNPNSLKVGQKIFIPGAGSIIEAGSCQIGDGETAV
jgi:LysM repeat protein